MTALIDLGADANFCAPDSGQTPLHNAVEHEHFSHVVPYLLGRGVDVNKQDAKGRTPLHYAVRRHDRKVRNALVKQLLDAGADRTLRDCAGKTPGDCVDAERAPELLELLGACVKNAAG